MELAIGVAVFLVWLVAAWAMLTMVVAGLNDRDRRSLGWFLGGSFVMASYNRKYLRIFAACIGVGVALWAVFMSLFLTGHIAP